MAALREAAPHAHVDVAHSLEEAQNLVVNDRPDLFVLDVDATYDLGQEFLYDLRTSHPNARAIVLTAVHLASQRERAAGLGAIHFLEKPFPHADFVTLVEALLHAGGDDEGTKFQGKLSDLHIADIVQLKCMSGATSVLEFTGPRGEKARVWFENGQVRHAVAPGRDGIAAFNEIVDWKGGTISEVAGAGPAPRTIDLDWQVLLMEAVRKIDEAGAAPKSSPGRHVRSRRKVLVIDDSVMLLSFVKEILGDASYDAAAAATAEEGLRTAASERPDLILLDYILPDMKGDEVLARLLQDETTAQTPVIYMSGFGADLPSDPTQHPNVVGSLNKPFTSELLLKTVETYMPTQTGETEQETLDAEQPVESGWAPADNPDAMTSSASESQPESTNDPFTQTAVETSPQDNPAALEAAAGGGEEAWWSAAPSPTQTWSETTPEPATTNFESAPAAAPIAAPPITGSTFFSGDSSFFSLNWALHTISTQKLTGTMRCFWNREPVDLLARDGQILLATSRDPDLYCPESPITLVNVDQERTNAAREQQRQSGQPLFIALAQENLILREPALQLVQHYGQKLFAQMWTLPRVRFAFEQADQLPAYANDVPAEEDVDHWALGTLRFIQFQELGNQADYDPSSIPAYTRDGFQRVQNLRLTVAEAQFASQFNGARSIAQIAKNLRLDLKFARLTLFRFMALEIVELWPQMVAAKQEKRGIFGRMFGE